MKVTSFVSLGLIVAFLTTSTVDATDAVASPDNARLMLHLRAGSLAEQGLKGGDSVSRWSDSSGNDRHGTSKADRQPIFVPDGLNGKPAIYFDGQNDCVETGLALQEALAGDFTIIVVADAAQGHPEERRALSGHFSGKGMLHMGLLEPDGRLRHYYLEGKRRKITTEITRLAEGPVKPFVLAMEVRGTQLSGYLNGCLRSAATNSRLQPESYASPARMAVGCRANRKGMDFWQGHIAEILVYQGRLSRAERKQIEGELFETYDIEENPAQGKARLKELYVIDDLGDADGAQVADIDGDGKPDVVAASSRWRDPQGVRHPSRVYWYRQGESLKDWTRHPVYAEGSKLNKVEGIDVGDFDSDQVPEIVVVDQNRKIALFSPDGSDVTGPWSMTVLDPDAVKAQDSLVADVDDDNIPELLYTWEGAQGDQGGINMLDFQGGDVMKADSWKRTRLVRHPGAWWLCSSGRLDLDNDGRQDDIVFSARRARHKSARPGLFWLQGPNTPGGRWKEHVIDDSLKSALHVDSGDFDGDGVRNDIVSLAGPFEHIYLYTYPDWKRQKLFSVGPGKKRRIFNVRRASYGVSDRDDIFSAVARDHAYIFEWTGSEYLQTPLFETSYRHPLDDRIIYADLDGDGVDEAVVPDSGGDRLLWLSFAGPDE